MADNKEYIEREAALKVVCMYCCDYDGDDPNSCGDCIEKVEMLAVPSADVEPVRHGEWKEYDMYICNSDDEPVAKIGVEYICSECGRKEEHKEPYCHCGAKMDGKCDA